MALTGCALTTGIELDCRDSNGGIEKVYIANADGEVTFTQTGGTGACAEQVDDILLDGVSISTYYEFDVPKQTSSFTETATISSENGTVFYEQVATLIFNKMQCATRDQLLLMAQNTRMLVIVKDNNGNYWTVGLLRGAELTAATTETGVSYGDRNGYTLTITGREISPTYNVDPAVVA